MAFALWPFGFALSAWIPVTIGWQLAEVHGRVGVVFVVMLVFLGGYLACWKTPDFILTAALGGVMLGAIQLIAPPLVYLIGFVAMGGAVVVRAARFEISADQVNDPDAMAVLVLSSEMGGIVVAGLTSVMLFMLAIVLGQGMRFGFDLVGRLRAAPESPRRLLWLWQ